MTPFVLVHDIPKICLQVCLLTPHFRSRYVLIILSGHLDSEQDAGEICIYIYTVSIYSKMTSPELCLDFLILCLVFFEVCTAVGCLMTANQRQFRTSYKHTYISSAQFTSLLFPFPLSISLIWSMFFFKHSALLQLFIMASHISRSYRGI